MRVNAIYRIRANILYVHDITCEKGAHHCSVATAAHRSGKRTMKCLNAFWREPVCCRDMDQFAVERRNRGERRFAKLPRICRDRFEHWLHVGLRLANDPQNLTSCCLLLKTLLQLIEQSRVLDRDYR